MVLRSVGVVAFALTVLGGAAVTAVAATRTTLRTVRLVENTRAGKVQTRLGFTACGTTGRLRVKVRELHSPSGKDTPVTDEMTRSTVFKQDEKCQRTIVFWQPRKTFLRPGRYIVRLSVSAGGSGYSTVISRHVDRKA
jgi:hypothetical protein